MNITMLWLAAKARRKGVELAVSSHRSQAYLIADAFLEKSGANVLLICTFHLNQNYILTHKAIQVLNDVFIKALNSHFHQIKRAHYIFCHILANRLDDTNS
jgi:hypothetical protein